MFVVNAGDIKSSLVDAFDVRAKFDSRFGVWTLKRLVCQPNGNPKWLTMFDGGTGPYGRPMMFGQDRAAAEAAAEDARRSLRVSGGQPRQSWRGRKGHP